MYFAVEKKKKKKKSDGKILALILPTVGFL
jgi:hypothetical protein